MNGFAALDIHSHRRYVVDIGGRRSSRCRLHINFALFLHSLDFTQNLGVTPLIIAGSDTPEIFQAAKTALYYIPALVSLPVIFPGVKQILGWWNCILGTLLSKEKSNFLCPIRPIAQNVAALDFSKLLQKRDGLVTISAVASRY